MGKAGLGVSVTDAVDKLPWFQVKHHALLNAAIGFCVWISHGSIALVNEAAARSRNRCTGRSHVGRPYFRTYTFNACKASVQKLSEVAGLDGNKGVVREQ